VSITDRNSLRDILEPLLRPSLIEDGLESLRAAQIEGNAEDDAKSRFVDGVSKREGNADDALRRFLELLDSESLLGWNGMLVEGFGCRVVEGGWCRGSNVFSDNMVDVLCGGKVPKRG
jgi:hypothetical protein